MAFTFHNWASLQAGQGTVRNTYISQTNWTLGCQTCSGMVRIASTPLKWDIISSDTVCKNPRVNPMIQSSKNYISSSPCVNLIQSEQAGRHAILHILASYRPT